MSDFYELDIDEKVEDYNFDSSISFYKVKNPNWQYFKDNVAPTASQRLRVFIQKKNW